ncbi:MAG: hypothetical protein PVJ23_02140, partial [Anaerolineae bacterium]
MGIPEGQTTGSQLLAQKGAERVEVVGEIALRECAPSNQDWTVEQGGQEPVAGESRERWVPVEAPGFLLCPPT